MSFATVVVLKTSVHGSVCQTTFQESPWARFPHLDTVELIPSKIMVTALSTLLFFGENPDPVQQLVFEHVGTYVFP